MNTSIEKLSALENILFEVDSIDAEGCVTLGGKLEGSAMAEILPLVEQALLLGPENPVPLARRKVTGFFIAHVMRNYYDHDGLDLGDVQSDAEKLLKAIGVEI